jgi:hypothetical protein
MAQNDVAPACERVPQNAQHSSKRAEHPSNLSVAPPISLRARRHAAMRLPPLDDGRHDPLDPQREHAPIRVEWEGHDVTDLGLLCSHSDDRCPGRRHRVA